MRITIAIDGPAGAGKSTVAKSLAEKLDILYLDTGAMYRAVALKTIRDKIDNTDEKAVTAMLGHINIQVRYIDGRQHTFLDGEDVSAKIRTGEVSLAASRVAVIKSVRLKMVALQREIADNQSVVMDGRDIGTYVLPHAHLKFFLTASPEERANRRLLEYEAKGEEADYHTILADIKYRDENDSNRDFAPLKKADDAIVIDSTHLMANEVLDLVMSYVSAWKTENTNA